MYAGDFSSYMRIKPEILPGVWGEVQRSRPTLSRGLLYSDILSDLRGWEALSSSGVAELTIRVDCFPVAAEIGRATLRLTSKEAPGAVLLSQPAACHGGEPRIRLRGRDGRSVLPRKGTSFHIRFKYLINTWNIL